MNSQFKELPFYFPFANVCVFVACVPNHSQLSAVFGNNGCVLATKGLTRGYFTPV